MKGYYVICIIFVCSGFCSAQAWVECVERYNQWAHNQTSLSIEVLTKIYESECDEYPSVVKEYSVQVKDGEYVFNNDLLQSLSDNERRVTIVPQIKKVVLQRRSGVYEGISELIGGFSFDSIAGFDGVTYFSEEGFHCFIIGFLPNSLYDYVIHKFNKNTFKLEEVACTYSDDFSDSYGKKSEITLEYKTSHKDMVKISDVLIEIGDEYKLTPQFQEYTLLIQ